MQEDHKTIADAGPQSMEKSRRYELLHLGHQKALDNWEQLLIGTASRERLESSFRNIAQSHPDALESAVRGDHGGFLLSLLKSELPMLQKALPSVGDALCRKLIESIKDAVKSEVKEILDETNLHQKLLELENLESDYKKKADQDEIMHSVPKVSLRDELRATTMAAKTAYEEMLAKEVEMIEAENKDLEKKLHSLNKRATLVATNMDNQLQLLQEVGGSAREFLHSSQTAPPLPFDTEDSLG